MSVPCLIMLILLGAGCDNAERDLGSTAAPPVAAPAGPASAGSAGMAAAAGSGAAPLQPTAAGMPASPGSIAGSSAAAAAGAAAPSPPITTEPAIARPAGWQDASHARGAKPDYARLFADDRVHRIDIEMSAASQQAVNDDLEMLLGDDEMEEGGFGQFPGFGMPPNQGNPLDLVGGDPIYVPVTIRYDGAAWTQVGMRLKGNSSLASAWRQGIKKIGFRLDFDRYELESPETTDQRFYGFAKMTFSSGFNDPSLIRDKLAGEVLTARGLVSARCAFYRVYVDAGSGPVYWGLYTMIEDPSDQLIEEQFADKSGNLYKPDGPGATFTTFDMASFEKKSNEEAADYSDVMSAISALNAPRSDAQAWRDGLEAVFNVESFLDVVAFSRAIGHWDGYGVMAHNYYLYGDPSDAGRLLWISWDHNLSWQGSGGFSFGAITPMMDEITEEWPLIRFLLDDPVYRAQYVESLRASLGGSYEKAAFDGRARALHTQVAPYVVGPEGERAPYTFVMEPAQFESALTDPERGLISAADALRQAVVTAVQ